MANVPIALDNPRSTKQYGYMSVVHSSAEIELF